MSLPGVVGVYYARWWPVCVSQRPSQRHRSPRSSLDWARLLVCGGAAWVRCAHAAGPVSSPPTLHTRPASTHQPHTRDCQEIWRSVEVGLSSNYAAAVITRDCCLVDVLHCVTRVLAEYGQWGAHQCPSSRCCGEPKMVTRGLRWGDGVNFISAT